MKKLIALLLLPAILLSAGCQKSGSGSLNSEVEKITSKYASVQGYLACISASSPGFDCVFSMDYNKDTGFRFFVSEPETIEGLKYEINTAGTKATFNGLEVNMPKFPQSSPASVCVKLFSILSDGNLNGFSWKKNDNNEIICYNEIHSLAIDAATAKPVRIETELGSETLAMTFDEFDFIED